MSTNDYDAVVIGAGAAGLVSAARLAKEGLNILLVEQHSIPGGYCTSFNRKGFNFDVDWAIFGMEKGGIVSPIIDGLQIRDKLDFAQMEELCEFIFPDQRLIIPNEMEKVIACLIDRFPHERDGIVNFFATARAIFEGTDKTLVNQYQAYTFDAMVHEFISDKKLCGMLNALWWMGVGPQRVSAIEVCNIWMTNLIQHCYYPRGGYQRLPNALADAVRTFGGDIRFKNKVEKIFVEHGKVCGIELDNGETLSVPLVISGADARRTLLGMVGEDKLPAQYIDRLLSMRPSISGFIVWLGLDVDPRQLGEVHRLTFLQTGYDFDALEVAAVRGDVGEHIVMWFPSLEDTSVVPEGMHILCIVNMVAYESKLEWQRSKERIAQFLIGRVEERMLPGLSEHIVLTEVATPLTLERYTSNTGGAVAGWELTPDQVGENRLQQVTPIRGLILAGHWTVPGPCVVGAMVSGWQAAEIALQNRK